VMIQGDDSFAELQKHLDDKGVTVLYQASSVAKGYLSAFIKEFYLHWNSNVLRQYRKLAIFPADIVFEKEPDFKGMLSHLDNKDLVLVMANQEGSDGRISGQGSWKKTGNLILQFTQADFLSIQTCFTIHLSFLLLSWLSLPTKAQSQRKKLAIIL